MDVTVCTPIWERRREDWAIIAFGENAECQQLSSALFIARAGNEGDLARPLDRQDLERFRDMMCELHSALEGCMRDMANAEKVTGERTAGGQFIVTQREYEWLHARAFLSRIEDGWKATVAIYDCKCDTSPILSFDDDAIELLAKDLGDAILLTQAGRLSARTS
jgi:hypothetical protein